MILVVESEGIERSRRSYQDSLARAERDIPILEQADNVIATLRELQIENHWASRIAANFRGL